MGKRGPKPLSAEELAARGSNRAKRRAAQESQAAVAPEQAPATPLPPEELRAPPRPDWLVGLAAEKWAEVIPILERMQVLTIADSDVVARYCQAWKAWREAEQTLDKEGLTIQSGSGNIKQHPAVRIRESMASTLNALSDRLGLSPEARKALNVAQIFKRSAPAPSASKPDPAPATQTPPPSTGATIDGEEFFRRRG